MAILEGNEVRSTEPKRMQVYLATHDGEGNRLPFMNRSFMSFTFGGKAIEDFQLIVTLSDRLNKNVYAGFEDSTSDYDTLDGQYYWGTHMQSNTLDFTLSTDCITQVNLDNFKRWFRPGIERELILAEHPNRAIMARVSAPPSISMIPYGEEAGVTIKDVFLDTMTTIYKGDITISFIMDEPFWYGKLNYIPAYINDQWESVENGGIATESSKDFRKIILEDGIPYQTDMNSKTFLGGNQRITELPVVGEAKVNIAKLGGRTEEDGINIDSNNNETPYLFYSGTARSKPTLIFKLTPVFASGVGVIPYIIHPLNKISNNQLEEYSNITLEYPDETVSIFKFTTPSFWTGYNQALKVASEYNNTDSIGLKEQLQDSIKEYYSRKWALGLLSNSNIVNSSTGALAQGWKNNFYNLMRSLFNEGSAGIFVINSETGEATAVFNNLNTNLIVSGEIEENVGDMIKSDYLIIDYRNILENGKILAEEIDSNTQEIIQATNCTKITSTETLINFKILYKNMYL